MGFTEDIEAGGAAGKKKSKRGRPPAFENNYYQQIKQAFPDLRTRRGIVNKMYFLEGLRIIEKMRGVEYLIDEKNKTMKICILTELGRLNNEQSAREVASFICEEETAGNHKTAHEWAAIIRKYRIKDNQ